jgi:hypothetical protein
MATIALMIVSLLAFQTTEALAESTLVKVLKTESGSLEIISAGSRQSNQDLPLQVTEYPQFIQEHHPVSRSSIIELTSTDPSRINHWLSAHGVGTIHLKTLRKRRKISSDATDEVRTIVGSGPSENRINLVFMGDGYTAQEREKFFEDIGRLTKDLFVGKTFKSYLPIFNVHAVFRPSQTSGIGRGSPVDTAYGLYRDGETLRAIFPGNPSAIRESCNQAPACDYPVVIANDPYYGGLGGEFAISTSSETSGSVVLRHELGHNFGRVGEEYDGGGYFGANFSMSPYTPNWLAWVESPDEIRREPMIARFIDWPWHKLDKAPFTARLRSNGKFAKTYVRLSASGIETPDTLSINLDGKDLDFTSPNRPDRSFVNIELPGLSPGDHTLTIREKVLDHNNWLSSLTVHEYASDFNDRPGHVGAFPVFDKDLEEYGFRPTNESCLMRDMTYDFFCPVCQENNWIKFFEKISLIDKTSSAREGNQIIASIETLDLSKSEDIFSFTKERKNLATIMASQIEIRWYADGQELEQFRNKKSIMYEPATPIQNLEVESRLLTSEVRKKHITSTIRLPL